MTRKSQRPTLKTISEMTGLAVPTVSRALSGATDIGAATRQRVQRIAKEIGYVPNRAGVRLRTGRSYVVALVLSTETDVMNLTAKLINAVATGLRDTRYTLTITPAFPDDDPLALIQMLVETRAADAIILNQIQPDDARVRYLMAQGFPFATHGRTAFAQEHDYYDFDNREMARIAVTRLAARGRQRFVLVAPPRDQFYAQEMIAGAQAAADGAGVSLQVLEGATSDDGATRIEAAIAPMLKTGADAVICPSVGSCMACVDAIEAQGLQVAEDVDVFSKEAMPFLTKFRPGILTQFEDARAAGAFLAQAVLQRIERPDAPLMQHLDVPQA